MGTIMVAGSAVAYSFAGYFTRLIPLDVATLLFWRGLFAGLTLSVIVVLQHRGQTLAVARAIGWTGLGIAGVTAISAFLYIAALRATTVADVAVIYTTVPLVTAALAWLLFGERDGWRAIVAGLVALVGSVVMVGGALGQGHLAGDLLALAMTVLFALVMVVIRDRRGISMLPAMALSGFLMALGTWPFARTGPLAELPMLHLALFGSVQFGAGLVLLTLGMRRITATRAALISLLDTPLAPLWVWLAFGEVPPATTLVGGSIVLAAVLWHVLSEPAPAAVPATRLQADPACPM